MDENLFLDGVSKRFVVVGGFLGAGKTTLIGKLSQWLEQRGLRTALVTNDQGDGLMDTDSARNSGTAGVEEITGGCFCCRLDDLVCAVKKLDAEARPDVIVAEPVGSCTDLMATVVLPLETVYQLPFSLSPLSVVLDARRALAALGGRRQARDFHRDVGYVFRKQVEEAEWLVVNKIDLISTEELSDLKQRLATEYPDKRIFIVSAKTGEGLEAWFEALMGHAAKPERLMKVDYERYAIGEAMLGWVNSEGSCVAQAADVDWGSWLGNLGDRIASQLDETGAKIGHFKMSIESDGRRWRFHRVMSGEVSEIIEEPGVDRGEVRFLVNLRAEGDAGDLEAIVDAALAEQSQVKVTFKHRAAFQPGEPRPTHRVTELAG
ncbi:GTP-binding protein [Haloferula sargassicola]|uniref:CobW/HypB/UreG nucleotide-binding domain-containing protein n=1 Tax=Haloferula sargassicola TaxID=490096 RepID=A0ABP9UTX9_9BACT